MTAADFKPPFLKNSQMIRTLITPWVLVLVLHLVAAATLAQAPPSEADYYKLIPLPIPEGIVLEAGGIELLPDGNLAVTTRRGEIYIVENAFADPPSNTKYRLFAQGLHEVLGVVWRDGWLYVTQRCEVSRLKDTDGDGRAELFETVSDGWGISGDYHEYAFGSSFDRQGNLWVVLCLTGSYTSEAKFRGWCLRITPGGQVLPTCSGIRSPGGIGPNAAGDMFYTDNQGPWNGTCSLKHLAPGDFLGHPVGNRWYHLAPNMEQPEEPRSGSRFHIEAARIPRYRPAAVLFPYGKMGQSAAGIACDLTGGRFGPFQEQLFVGDQTHSTVMRVTLEKVNGVYQGACYPFRAGFGSGSLSLKMCPDGSLFVGGTNRGWGSRGIKPYSLDRLVWTGKTPFEIQEMRAKPDGFELAFTKPVDPVTAGAIESYKLQTYTYIFQAQYGSPEVDHTTPAIEKLDVSSDRQRVRLYVKGLQQGHIHELVATGVRSADGQGLLHPEAYYTLNYIPK
jgi:glucose/arabinose dehydrogenase